MADFDFIVIGGGSGGIASARRAAAHGARVALIERGPLGGTCVNVGCVPKKVMWNAAQVAKAVHDAPSYGLQVDFSGLDWSELRRRRDRSIERLQGIYAANLESSGVTVLRGSARFTSSHTVEVEGQRLSAPHVLLATGSRPLLPVVPGATFGATSDDFFWLDQRPESVAVVGGGYVAVEVACTLLALGSKVTLLCRAERLLRHFDAVLGERLAEAMAKDGAQLHFGVTALRLERDDSGLIRVHTSDAVTRSFDWVLWAIGRAPVTQGLGLQSAGVELQASGHVRVDDFQNTTAAGVYALGDVSDRNGLTPVAIAAGRKLADRLFGGQAAARLEYVDIPSVIFSHPPIGTVGLSEAEACARYGAHNVRVYESRFTNLYYTVCDERRATEIKVVTRLPDEKLLGIHMIGLAADEVIQGFAVALKMGGTKADLDRTVAIHPTAGEELVTLTRHRLGAS